jgi:hypothetical protein|tara:strand:- start:713 stop:964 length:252 start_codon:yes stop_codon:yes gene_type:complete
MSDYSDSQAIKIIKNIDSSLTTKRDGNKLKIIDIDGKLVGTIKGGLTEKKIRTATGMKFGGAVKKMNMGGVIKGRGGSFKGIR